MAAACLPSLAHALGLGPVAGTPVLGEPLQLEVPLTGSLDRPLDVDCVSIRRAPEGIDPDYFPRDLVPRIDRQSGTPRLILLGRNALRQPLVEFRLGISCGYNVAHDYVLMASPRSERPQPAATTTAAPASPLVAPISPAVPPVATGLSDRPATKPAVREIAAPAVATARPAEAAGQLPDGLPGNNITLDREMTLEQLARQHFPGPLRQGRFMRWVAEANPQLFAGVANLREHRLPAGTQLVVPAGVPPRRAGDHQHGMTPLGEPMAAMPGAASSAAAGAAATRPASAAAEAPLPPRVPAAGRKDRLVVGSGGGGTPEIKETIALVDRLTGMMQEQVAAQSANHEKVQQLEATVAELGKTLARVEAEARQREAALQAELRTIRSERENESRDGWQLVAAGLAGGLLSIVLLWIYRLFVERRRMGEASFEFPSGGEPAIEADVAEPSARAVPEPRLAEPVIAPPAAPTAPRQKAATPAMAPSRPSAAASPAPSPAPSAAPAPATAAAPLAASAVKFEPPPAAKPAPILAEPISLEPTDQATAAIELANIMASMGLADSAAQALATHIRENPRESLPHWIKLLELHRANGNRAEFDRSANEMRQQFNIQIEEWAQGGGNTGRDSLEAYGHIRSRLIKSWRQPECLGFLESLLTDNREGTRVGFPLAVAEELLLLVAILNDAG